jgi:glyoxylase-like metal-dependent hydrolase (beta-lactamase superfamily II)
MAVSVKVFSSGYCYQLKNLALSGAASERIRFYALFALIRHPQAGYILFDTGYSHRFFEETRRFPYSLYAKATPVSLSEHGPAAQLQRHGIAPEEIRLIVLSHFHSDHVGAIKDFPQAKFLCLKAAYEDVRHKRGIRALMKGILPGLLPERFDSRLQFMDTLDSVALEPQFDPFKTGYDLMGDGSLLGVELPGHAKGQAGLIVKGEGGTYFFIADACWLSESYRKDILPHPLAQVIFSNRQQYKETLSKIHQLHQNNAEVMIIPTHCPEVWRRFVREDS